jgi:uncharacterized protein YeaO (DUF488 family)
MTVRARRVYEAPDAADGRRVLVDRLWPRGLAKAAAHIDEWLKAIAPSDELRVWYGHDPAKFGEFRRRYDDELRDPERAAALAQGPGAQPGGGPGRAAAAELRGLNGQGPCIVLSGT